MVLHALTSLDRKRLIWRRMLAAVADYTDYRCFLRDYLNAEKARRPRFSYGQWAKALKLRSPSTLIMILRGQRNPSAALTEKMIRHFKFAAADAHYFRHLVLLQKNRNNPSISLMLMEELAKSRRDQRFDLVDLDTFAVIADWPHHVMRQGVRLASFREDPTWLTRRSLTKVTPKQLRDATKTLLKLGLLRRRRDGRLVQGIDRLDTPNDVASEGLKRFHEQALDHAKQAIRRTPPTEREIRGLTLCIRQQNLQQAKALIRKFHQDFCALMDDDAGDTVFQLETAFFPILKGDSLDAI